MDIGLGEGVDNSTQLYVGVSIVLLEVLDWHLGQASLACDFISRKSGLGSEFCFASPAKGHSIIFRDIDASIA